MGNPILTPPIKAVEPDKFLLDYKILIFVLIVFIISTILACKKKSWRKVMIALGVSDVIVTIVYVYIRIYVTNALGYMYFLETNNNFDDLASFAVLMVVIFLVIFLSEKVIKRFKGGK